MSKKTARRRARRRRVTPGGGAPRPAMRYMSVIAQDPSVKNRSGGILMAKVTVPAEELVPGPIGYRVQVVDYNSTTRKFRDAHALPATFGAQPKRWRDGARSLVDDYRFHAQNVYALVMKTLARFEFALGRRVGWSFDAHQLKIAPHGMLDANAFYSPGEEGLVFGYFPGRTGRTIYTCLSHDVVVHETTHALVDALRERYLDPSSPDQAAFHEGFADVVALLSVFSQKELIAAMLRRPASKSPSRTLIHRKDIAPDALKDNALLSLAEQMGGEMEGVRGGALRRSVTLDPEPGLLAQSEFLEPHRRGEVFVAAVMNAFVDAWSRRIDTSGAPGQQLYPIARVAEDGADIAEALMTMWIRALDYMPPVHLEFPDALSAALTADLEVRPDDSRFELRRHLLRSFRRYEIEPASPVRNLPGIWEPAPAGLRYDRVRFDSMRSDKDEVFRFLWENRGTLWTRHNVSNLERAAYSEVLSVRPCVRAGLDGFILRETVAEYYQVARLTVAELRKAGITLPAGYQDSLRRAQRETGERRSAALPAAAASGLGRSRDGFAEDDEALTTPIYGGGALIFDEYGRLKYHVHNELFQPERQSRRLAYLWEAGFIQTGRQGVRFRAARLSTMHRLRSMDARRYPAEAW
ncbi:MAG: hypothetical protein HYU41_12215 [Candidatus Rokubacteria bacterium]|nr:hypothetical protein [Candidatus Rokubacteria bacterium]